MAIRSTQSDTSWWDRLIDRLSGGTVPPPLSPRPPGVDQGAWAKNVERARISPYLGTVHDLGLIVFGETQSYSDRPDSNEPLIAARQKMAHSIINAGEKWGARRMTYARTHGPVEPSERALNNPAVRAAYESSMQAAREAFLSGADPTNGAVFTQQLDSPTRSNFRFRGGRPQGVPLSTQSGPYNNSYIGGQVESRTAWLNTYWDR
jgi:hypothetical protein